MIGSTNSIWNVNGIYEQIVNYTMLYDVSFNDIDLNQCKEVTGGWVVGQNLSNYSGGAYAMEATGMTCGDNSSGYGSKYLSTNKKINVANYKAVLLNADTEWKSSSYNANVRLSFPR